MYKKMTKCGIKMDKQDKQLEIRYVLRSPEEIEKFNIVKKFLKKSLNTRVIDFLLTEKYQEIQKIKT
jgi:spermidine/putrescine-binding protein